MNSPDYSLSLSNNRVALRNGIRDAVPIGLGYFAVSFSLGVAAGNAGLNILQSFIASLFCNASAGEYAGFSVIAAAGTYLEIAVMTLIANARYLLMSCAMSQRLAPGVSTLHRLAMAFDITDELFGIAIARPGYLNPNYTYGAMIVALPGWACGTALGCLAGNLLPLRLVSAFSVALYGMFLAIIIPPAQKDRTVAVLVAAGFVCSLAAGYVPGLSALSSGTRTIILTVALASAAAALCPIPAQSGGQAEPSGENGSSAASAGRGVREGTV